MMLSTLRSQILHGLNDGVRRELWLGYKGSLLANWHLITVSIGILALFRAEYTGLPLLVCNGLAMWLCKRPVTDQQQDWARKMCCAIVLLSWAWRTLVARNWSTGTFAMTELGIKSWTHSTSFLPPVSFLAEPLTNCNEQVHAYLILPPYAVAIQLAVHLYMMCCVQAHLGVLPSPALLALWLLANVCIPHLLIYHLRRSLATRTASPARQAAGQVGVHKQGRVKGDGSGLGASSNEAAAPVPRSLQDKQQDAQADLAAIQQLQQESRQRQEAGVVQVDEVRQVGISGAAAAGGTSSSGVGAAQPALAASSAPGRELLAAHAPSEAPQLDLLPSTTSTNGVHHPPDIQLTSGSGAGQRSRVGRMPQPSVSDVQQHLAAPDAAQVAQLLGSHALAPSPSTLMALRNARRLATASRVYQSKLAPAKVVIKLNTIEPESLAGDILAQSNKVLHHRGYDGLLVAGACVRKGCVLLTLDLQGPAPACGASDLALDADTLMAWLNSLLAEGTHLQPDAVAHVQLGRQRYTAAWCASSRTWVVSRDQPATSELSDTPCSLALLYLDSPVARLPYRAGPGFCNSLQEQTGELAACRASKSPSEPAQPGPCDAVLQAEVSSTAQWHQQAHVHVEGTSGCNPSTSTCQASSSTSSSSSTESAAPGLRRLRCSTSSDSSSSDQLTPVCSTPAHRHTHGQHRVNLLMQLQCPSPQQVVQFVGSDAAAAAAAGVPAPGDGFVCVQCVARAPWGTCLPVAVVGVEMEAQASGAGSMAAAPQMLAAVTLDVDLSTAPGPGAVQLEMWAGHVLLASAPLLLLPHPGAMPDLGHVSLCQADCLLDELQHHARAVSGDAPVSGISPEASGLPALLSDLGQVLFTADCISNPGRASSLPLEGPGAWGGVAAGIMAQHTGNPECLDSTLQVAEGLVEYAQAQGLDGTLCVVSASAQVIRGQLDKIRGPGASPAPLTSSRPQLGVVDKQQQQPTVITAVVFGFQGGVESEYALWVNRHCSRLVNSWRPVFLLWLLVSAVRSLKEGDAQVVSHLPVHILLALPYTAGILLSARGQTRWNEALVVLHAVMRAVVCCACASNLLVYPSSYGLGYRLRLHIWVEALNAMTEPLRLPSLLITQLALLIAALARVSMAGEGAAAQWIAGAVAQRGFILLIGLLVDLRRRATFQQMASHNQLCQEHKQQHQCSRAASSPARGPAD